MSSAADDLTAENILLYMYRRTKWLLIPNSSSRVIQNGLFLNVLWENKTHV